MASDSDIHLMKRKTLTRTTFPCVVLGDNQAATLLQHPLAQLSPLAVGRYGPGQQAHMERSCTADRSQTTLHPQLATTYDQTYQKNDSQAMVVGRHAQPTEVPQTGVY